MPGIAGVVSHHSGADHRATVALMLQTMMHEPFYTSGIRSVPDVNVWAGWVAHEDSFAAKESNGATTHDTSLVFAGECFQEDGEQGRPDSRTSLLRLYDGLGDSWVLALNGLFSGLLVDRRRGFASLFNDRYGVERLYVHETGDATYFASEAKALLRVLPELRAFDNDGVADFLAFGCPLDGRTLFHGIRLLEGGSVWTFEGGSARKRRYFRAVEWERQPALSTEDFQSEFERIFQKRVPHYFHSASRVGVSLTGGLDSRMIMACLPALEAPPICYTFAGPQGALLDATIAKRVATECGLEHQVLRIGADFLTDYGAYLDRTVYATDGAAGALWTHEIYLNEQARRLATVRLTGTFGSEILRSMSTLKPVRLNRALLAPEFVATVAQLEESASTRWEGSISHAAFREIPWSLFGIVASASSQLTFRTPYLDNDLVALTYRAPASVRRSSASALRLVNAANPRLARIATDRADIHEKGGFGYFVRRLSAEVAFKLDYMYQESPVPGTAALLRALVKGGFLGGHKWLPYRLWFREELRPYVTETLTERAGGRLPFWSRQAVTRTLERHVTGRENHVREINALLTLAAVDRLLLRANWSSSDVPAHFNHENTNSSSRNVISTQEF